MVIRRFIKSKKSNIFRRFNMNKIILALNKMLNEFDYSVKTEKDKKRYRLKTPFEFLKSKSGAGTMQTM